MIAAMKNWLNLRHFRARRSHEYHIGDVDFRLGLPFANNPYAADEQRLRWEAGWRAAEKRGGDRIELHPTVASRLRACPANRPRRRNAKMSINRI